jgi:hypothetical protein
VLAGLQLPAPGTKKPPPAGNHATRSALLLRFHTGDNTCLSVFRDAAFDADHIKLMSSAFEDVSQQLGLGRREDAIRNIVARAILECAQRGIRDPIEMRKCARDVLQIA